MTDWVQNLCWSVGWAALHSIPLPLSPVRRRSEVVRRMTLLVHQHDAIARSWSPRESLLYSNPLEGL